jgi:hypothetical protein
VQSHLINLAAVEARVCENLLDGVDCALEEVKAQFLELGPRESLRKILRV